MNIDVRWVAKSASPGSAVGVTLDGQPTFVRLGAGMPDVQLVRRASGTAVLVRNGFMDKADRARQMGTLAGHVQIAGDVPKAIDEDVSIPDGTSVVYAQPAPATALPGGPVEWLLRDCTAAYFKNKTLMDTLLFKGNLRSALIGYFLSCNPYYGGKPGVRQGEPDASGSKEMTEYHWRGALGAAYLTKLGKPVPSVYREAPADRTRTGFWTPCGYYDAQGQPVRFSAQPDTLVDEKGLTSVGHGSFDRTSLSPYQLADIEHFTLDGEWTDAVFYNSAAAWLLLEHMGEALCSRSLCRAPTASLDPLRGRARVIKALALLVPLFPNRPQFALALKNVYAGLVAGFGTSPDGVPYAGVGPVKAVSATFTHVCVSPAEAAGKSPAALKQLQEDMRPVIVEWLGAALTALNLVRDIPAATACCPNLQTAIDHLGVCFAYARKPGIGNDGKPALPAPFQDSYAWRVPGRVHRPNLAWKGTMDWCAQAVTPAEMAKMPGSKIGTATAVECFWPRLGSAT